MNNTRKNSILVVILVLVVVAIIYLQAKKPVQVDPNTAPDVVVGTNATSTAAATPDAKPVAGAPALKSIAEKQKEYTKAKELVDIQGYVNSPAFKLSDFAGKKVILVDFWTYSCINCQRTIPYLNAWYQKYKDDGLVIVGVHTPEFDFEKDLGNVTKATKDLGIRYPVALDSNRGTWQAYQNNYWPHEYLVDIDGFVVHDHIGEGGYADTEKEIQATLAERSQKLGLGLQIPTGTTNPSDVITMDGSQLGSPETYFGSDRNEYLGNGNPEVSGTQTLTVPASTTPNQLYLGGAWNFVPEYAESTNAHAKIVYTFSAKNVYLVASSRHGVTARILIDGKPIDPSVKGADVSADATVMIGDNKLYGIYGGADYGTHTLEIDAADPGLQAYTFTFG